MPEYRLDLSRETDATITIGAQKLGVRRKDFLSTAIWLFAEVVDRLTINKGWKLAIVDENGVVKTTFSNLMKK